jgi:hypothetical protein
MSVTWIRGHRMRANLIADLEALADAAASDPTASHDRHVGWDAGQAGPVTAGRGLLIVNALAEKWGVVHRNVGKEVWFTLAAIRATEAPLCPCQGSRDGRAEGRAVGPRGGPQGGPRGGFWAPSRRDSCERPSHG